MACDEQFQGLQRGKEYSQKYSDNTLVLGYKDKEWRSDSNGHCIVWYYL
jgi:hypothetical protein